METIDILTSQNVTIQYALASVRDRIFSFVIDVIVIAIAEFLLVILFQFLFDGDALDYFTYIVLLPFFIFYSLISEILLNGQSIGKRLMGLKIVMITGREPTINDYLIRWAFRFIDIWFSLGTIAAVMISSGDRNQRLGDLLANTTVIKLNPWSDISLKEILSIHSTDTYTPTYDEVRKFSEEDMLFVKQTLDRCRRFNNTAHAEALNTLSAQVAGQLGLPEAPTDKMKFLRTVLNDYVVLSR